MENKLQKKYGLVTAFTMVIGIVIGSGVFFKAEAILKKTGGDLMTGLFAWLIGGAIMIICGYVFSTMATKYQKVNGVIDYAEATVGKKYAYFLAWYLAISYYPTLTSVLAYLSGVYTGVLFGFDGAMVYVVGFIYLILSFLLNTFSPKLAGHFQVSTTFIKLVPLLLMGVVGIAYGLLSPNGMLALNFSQGASQAAIDAYLAQGNTLSSSPLMAGVVSTAFAYEGWVIATTINSELKNPKRDLPLALVGGTITIMVVYLVYYFGLAGAVSVDEFFFSGTSAVNIAFVKIFGGVLGNLLTVFIVISCLGTLNGLMLGCCRGFYSIAVRGEGPAPEKIAEVNTKYDMPVRSSMLGMVFAILWYIYWIFLFTGMASSWELFGLPLAFDGSELPIVFLYPAYIPIFLKLFKDKDASTFNRIIAPLAAIGCCILMVYACVMAHGPEIPSFCVFILIVMAFGWYFMKKNEKNKK